MSLELPQDPNPRNTNPETGVPPQGAGRRSARAPHSFALENIDRSTPEHSNALYKLLHHLRLQHTVELSHATKIFLIERGLAEESAVHNLNSKPELPFFYSDAETHYEIVRLRGDLKGVEEYIATNPTSFVARLRRQARDTQTIEGAKALREQLRERLNELEETLVRSHNNRDAPCGHTFIRLTPYARNVLHTLDTLPKAARDPGLRAILKLHEQYDGEGRVPVLEHLKAITADNRIDDNEHTVMDVRKFYMAVVEGSIKPDSVLLEERRKAIEVHHAVDDYLFAADYFRREKAEEYLQSSNGPNYCPIPFPSWKADKDLAEKQSRAIVTRARMDGDSYSELAQETKRLPDGTPSLHHRFFSQCFEEVKGIYGSDLNVPPGRGFYYAGPIIEEMFFKVGDSISDGVTLFRKINREWLDEALQDYEQDVHIVMRGATVIANDSPRFYIDGEQYCYVYFNYHLTGSYDVAFLVPWSIVRERIRPCLYNLETGPTRHTADITKMNFTPGGLTAACAAANKPILNLTWMSTLFGSCAFAYPAMWPTFLNWESQRQGSAWKDINKHVHASYLIWSFRDNKQQVDAVLRPLQDKHFEVYEAGAGLQQKADLTMNRYNAWKCDQTPGAISTPRMLREVYSWYHQNKDAKVPRPAHLCFIDKERLLPPKPVINCQTLEVRGESNTYQLPIRSDGTEMQEILLWNEHVRPYLYNDSRRTEEGRFTLALIAEEYL